MDFLLGVRDGSLAARRRSLRSLRRQRRATTHSSPGGDAERGHAYFTQTCSQCHGADGSSFLLDDGALSLGMLMRVEGYETWAKILSGQPGTGMHAQVAPGRFPRRTHADHPRSNAATCDRTHYPKGAATGEDVPDGDPRCGSTCK